MSIASVARPVRLLLAVGPMLLSAPLASSGADACPDGAVILVDHLDGSVIYCGKKVDDGDQVRARVSKPIVVRVTNTNTALYAFDVSAEKVEAQEIEGLKSFLGALGPYLVELGHMRELTQPSERPAKTEPDRDEALRALQESLLIIDQQILSLRRVEVETLRALESMARSQAPEPVATAARALCKSLMADLEEGMRCDDDRLQARIRPVKALLEALQQTAENLRKLEKAAKGVPNPDVDELLAAGAKALHDAADILAEAYRIEGLARRAMLASDTWSSRPFSVSTSFGRRLSIAVSPRKTEELARLAFHEPITFTMTVQPDWLVRPAVGLAFLAAKDSTYPIYSTRESGDQFEIVQSDLQDSRFTYGLSMGLTWRGLDHRDDRGFAVMLPEITVNPSDDVKAVGIGAGVTFWRIVKLGGGLLWTKHKALDGQAPGDMLAAEGDLRLKDAYGKPKWYLSLSLVGWPPFLQK